MDEASTPPLIAGSVTGIRAESYSADIFKQGTATLQAIRVAGNVTASPREGGGIANEGVLNLTNGSLVTENTAERGGGVFNQGQLTVSGGGVITGNTADDCVDSGSGMGCPG